MSGDEVEAHLLRDFPPTLTWHRIVILEGVVTSFVVACDPEIDELRRAQAQLVARARQARSELENDTLADAYEFAVQIVETHVDERSA